MAAPLVGSKVPQATVNLTNQGVPGMNFNSTTKKVMIDLSMNPTIIGSSQGSFAAPE